MNLERRKFLAAMIAAPLLQGDFPKRTAHVVKLFKSPEGHPNALETAREGLWIGEQVTDRAHLVDWRGKPIRTVETESSNTSGIAFGDGSLWMAANGKAIGRPARPADATTGEVLQVDPENGKTRARHPIPGGGGVHGLEFCSEGLWITSLQIQKLTLVDPRTFRIIHQIPVHLGRAHGLAWDGGAIWCMHSTDRVIHKLSAKNGRILEAIVLSPCDPDPHGLCLHQGHLYYCDAGIAPGGVASGSSAAGYICRIDL